MVEINVLFFTENLLENTDGVGAPQQCSLGTAACYLLVMLTVALLMTSSHSKGPKGIRTNCVNPTVVMTAMGRKAWSDPVKAGPMLARIPVGRFAECEDVVNAIMFLLSDKAGMCNGTMLPVDGGFLST